MQPIRVLAVNAGRKLGDLDTQAAFLEDRLSMLVQFARVESRRSGVPVEVLIDRTHFPEPIASNQPGVVTIEGVADHITGSVRGVQEADILRRPFIDDPIGGERDLGGYRAGKDQIGSRMVGSRGIEAAFENVREKVPRGN